MKMHLLFLFLFTLLSFPIFTLPSPVQDPNLVVHQVQEKVNATRRIFGHVSCRSGNPIDDCWRCDKNWDTNRRHLAECAIGFGSNATGGKHGVIYEVFDPLDDPVNPNPGTLRHAVIQDEPLWITFAHDMVITLKQDLRMNSFKTIDGRGANVHIAGGPCIDIHNVSHIIIHGINIHDCKREGEGDVRDSPRHTIGRKNSDGDGISITMSRHIWVDHYALSRCTDGWLDASHGSTAITVSNNYMTNHNKVMLLGHSDSYKKDRKMQVTVAFNRFGEGLGQRMPRCRYGYFHVVNNDYTNWQTYAIGGSASPTINSQGNRFLASNDRSKKEVTKRENTTSYVWKKWNWRSEGDLFLNGAYFVPSGSASPELYAKAWSMNAQPSSLVPLLTREAGPLNCRRGRHC